VNRFSEPAFTAALGKQGETLVDAALPSVGFLPKARDVSELGGLQWTETKHNLDRVFEKDGVLYGTEVKNRLSYISQAEFRTKISICETLQLRPLFIARMKPHPYVHELFKRGGFALLMKRQFCPFGSESFAAEVRERLNLPVDTPTRLADGTLQRLLNYLQRPRNAGTD
jgi:predicted RecB family endonuclease